MFFGRYKKGGKYIQRAYDIYNDLKTELPTSAWDRLIISNINLLKKDITHTVEYFDKGTTSVYSWVLSATANLASDLLRSGEYGTRGCLMPIGEDFLKIYTLTTQKLVENGDATQAEVDESRKNLMWNIKNL